MKALRQVIQDASDVPALKTVMDIGDFVSLTPCQLCLLYWWNALIWYYINSLLPEDVYSVLEEKVAEDILLCFINRQFVDWFSYFGKSFCSDEAISYLTKHYGKCGLPYRLITSYIYLADQLWILFLQLGFDSLHHSAKEDDIGGIFYEMLCEFMEEMFMRSVFGQPVTMIKLLTMRYFDLLGLNFTMGVDSLGHLSFLFCSVRRQTWFKERLRNLIDKEITFILDCMDFMLDVTVPCSCLDKLKNTPGFLCCHRDLQLRHLSCCSFTTINISFPPDDDCEDSTLIGIYLRLLKYEIVSCCRQRPSIWIVLLRKLETLAKAYSLDRKVSHLSGLDQIIEFMRRLLGREVNSVFPDILNSEEYVQRLVSALLNVYKDPCPDMLYECPIYKGVLDSMEPIFRWLVNERTLKTELAAEIFEAVSGVNLDLPVVILKRYPKACNNSVQLLGNYVYLFMKTTLRNQLAFPSGLSKFQAENLWCCFSSLSLTLNRPQFSNLTLESFSKVDMNDFIKHLFSIIHCEENVRCTCDKSIEKSLRLSAGILLFLVMNKFPELRSVFIGDEKVRLNLENEIKMLFSRD